MIRHLALVPIVQMDAAEVSAVASAIGKQVQLHFAPCWDVNATVDVFAKPEDVPLGTWPIFIVDSAPSAGTHIDHAGQPIAYVEKGLSWSLAASHEALEMLADPFGTRLLAADSIEYLVEVCDPCQDAHFAYHIDGVLVSDFYTPDYFAPAGARYDMTGAIKRPRDVLAGGYLTWRDSLTGHWMQARDALSNVKDLGPIEPSTLGFRAAVDALTDGKRRLAHVAADHPRVVEGVSKRAQAKAASIERARRWRTLLD